MKKLANTFYIVAGLFFFWGFVAASNDVLIPIFKEYLHIEQWQGQMISFVFYVAYTVGSIIYLIISHSLKVDLLSKIGFSKGLIIGLIISFIGTLFFIPASLYSSFLALITGLFIIGLGFSLQQTAANPIVIMAGEAAYGSQRLSLAGGINNIGTTIGPLVVSFAVFGSSRQLHTIRDLHYPYLVMGILFLVIAGVLMKYFKNHPANDQNNENGFMVQEIKTVVRQNDVWMAMLAIFMYVGVEVSTAANLAEFARIKANISTGDIAPYIALYWACLMIGRWASASDIFANNKMQKITFKILFPFLAFAVFLFILHLNNKHVSHIEWMLGYIVILIVLDGISQGNAAKQLMIYALAGSVLLGIGIFTEGIFSVYNIMAVGLFCSTLWPCIFEIALKNKAQQAGVISSLLILMIMGGGWVSLLQGYLSKPLGINYSYIVGIVCFVYLFIYGWRSKTRMAT